MSKIFVFYFSFFLVNIYLFVFYPLFVPCFLSPPSLSCSFHPLCLAFLLLQSLQPLSSSPPQSAGRNLTFLNYLAAPVRAHLLTHVSQSVSTVSVGDTRSLSSSRSHTARGTHDDDDGLLDRDARPESEDWGRPACRTPHCQPIINGTNRPPLPLPLLTTHQQYLHIVVVIGMSETSPSKSLLQHGLLVCMFCGGYCSMFF